MSCAMPNDLHVSERHTPLVNHEHRHQPGEMRYRYFLGVKWSQVQILSARQREIGFELRLFVL